ncbi:MAG: protein kinase [Pyrinomonadaceae bacterium]|nr:protein kinase [Pyrinomonadaceae bacterium]
MTPERWQKVKDIFSEAVDLKTEDRAKFLDEAINGDGEMRREVEELLAADADAKTLFNGFSLVPPDKIKNKIGNYQIIKKIGEGGMGAVYLAERADLKQKVALKIIRHGADSDVIVRRFRREQEILAALEHANIARLLDVGSDADGTPFLAMEYVEGEDLMTFSQRKNLSVSEKLNLFRKVCEAVAYAHSRLIVHRDLKPSNILVNEKGEPKLLDFGISKILEENESEEKGTVTSFGMLTPNYASPEQFRGETVSTSTDVYSLGVILYELLTDRLPYEVANKRIDEVAQAVCETNPPRPSEAVSPQSSVVSYQRVGSSTDENDRRTNENQPKTNPKSKIQNLKLLRGDLDNILLKALRKEPARRYSSVEQFSEDLRRHLAGLPVAARPDTFSYRAEKFVKRNRVSVASAALVFLFLLIAVVGISSQYVRAERERRLAERRFADVRELANAFVFKYHDEIQNLPGSTRLREMLVKDALIYLDRLAGDDAGDVSLKIELAQAYMKIGDVQGQAYDANLGDTTAAIESYRKAVALLENAANGAEDLKTSNELIAAYQKFGSLLSRGGDEQSMEFIEKSVALAERLHAANPEDGEQILKLAGAYLYQADSLAPEYEAARVIEIYQKALRLTEKVYLIEPDNATALRRTVGLNQRLGFQYFLLAQNASETGKPERAAEFYQTSLPFYRRSLETAEKQFAAGSQNAVFRRTLFAVKLNVAQVERELGETETALRTQREVWREFSAVATADAANFEARSDLALVHDDLARTLARRGEFSAAFENFRRAEQLLDDAVNNDSRNKEFWRSRRDVVIRHGNALAASGDFTGAAKIYQSAFEQIKAAPMLQDAAWQKFYAGEMYEKLGDVSRELAEQNGISAAERLKYTRTAQANYQKAIECWRDDECWQRNFAAKPERFEFVAKKLADCQSKTSIA